MAAGRNHCVVRMRNIIQLTQRHQRRADEPSHRLQLRCDQSGLWSFAHCGQCRRTSVENTQRRDNHLDETQEDASVTREMYPATVLADSGVGGSS